MFFEILRVAIGVQENLSRFPSETEWEELFLMAQKQSLVGTCFWGLHRLGADADDGFAKINMSEELYLDWMGMAAQISMKNEIVNQQCADLQKQLLAEGFRSCVLKGQGIAALYGAELFCFRQSGDIDLWVDASKKETVTLAKKFGLTEEAGYLHVGARCFDDTVVELHFRPTCMRSVMHNRRIQKFCEGYKDFYGFRMTQGILAPSYEFNVIYLLTHIYRHLFGLGIGLRQLMDYYFVLRSKGSCSYDMQETLSYLGLRKVAGAVMCVMCEVFHLEEEYMICPVDEKRGRALLDSVLQTGNFGKMDDDQMAARSSNIGKFKYKIKQWWKMMRMYPEETLSAPVWAIFNKMQ